MNASFTWLSEDNPLPAIEKRWIDSGEITPDERRFLRTVSTDNNDIRLRETARILLSAIENNTEAEPHAQRLLRMRNISLFRKMVRPVDVGV